VRITLLSIIFLVGCSQKNAHQLTATEEFTLRGKCAELGHQMEKAAQADDAAADERYIKMVEQLVLAGKVPPDNNEWFHNWRVNYNVAQNRCYALDTKHSEKFAPNGSTGESDPPVTVLYDAQTQEALAQIWSDAGQIKHGTIMRIDSRADDVGYDDAKKFIDERMGEVEAR
jgi:hypothetical protein